MKIYASVILLFGIFAASNISGVAQSASLQSQEAKSLVSHLSWDSIGMDCEGLGNICAVSDVAKRLVQIGKPATESLLKVLKDKNKGIAAHVILTQIWEPTKAKGRMTFARNKFIFTYNGLEWSKVFKNNGSVNKVEKYALINIAVHWNRQINYSSFSKAVL